MNEMETNKTEVLLMLFVEASSSILSSLYIFFPTDISILTGWPSFKMDTIFFPSFLLINIVTTSLPVKKKKLFSKMYSIITVYVLIFFHLLA